MRVAHISHTDAGAGAGRAAYRIHRSLLDLGVDSQMFVSSKRTGDASVVAVSESNRFTHFYAKVNEYLNAKLSRAVSTEQGLYSKAQFSRFSQAANAGVASADVVALYWINGGFVSPESLARLKQPVVWRLSDVWPFTGGCHYPGDCERFVAQCGECPQLKAPSARDGSYQLMQRKLRAWRDVNLTIATPSTWMAELARKSALFRNRRIEVVPTGVDTQVYQPLARAEARAKWGIPQDKIVLLFGAMDVADRRKGFAELKGALEILAGTKWKDKLLAVIFGQANLTAADVPIASHFLGRLTDDASLRAAYSAADMVIVPSLEDNLPNVGLEAIACGAPVVGFDVCGMKDIVQHGWNGMLAPKVDAVSLAVQIEQMLAGGQLQQMSAHAREHALARFSLTKQAQSYLQLYQELAGR